MVDFGVLNDSEPEPGSIVDAGYPEIEEQLAPPPARRDPFDPAPLLKLFDQYDSEIKIMLVKANALQITDEQSAETASLYTTQARKLAAVIEDRRKELKEPYLKVTAVLDAETKKLKDHLLFIQTLVNQRLTPYLREKERLRQEAERKAREEAARIQRELEEKARKEREAAAEEARQKALAEQKSKEQAEAEAQAAAAMVETPPVVVAETVPQETRMKTDSGSVDLKKEWVFQIISIKQIPDAAFEARKEQIEKAIGPWISAQIKAGVRTIPGVRIYEEAKVKTRLR